MADQRLTELAALATIVDSDILYVVDDPGGSPLSKKITRANLFNVAFSIAGDITFDGQFHPVFSPGSDTDHVFLESDVTGTPTLSWDESEDAIYANKKIQSIDIEALQAGAATFPIVRCRAVSTSGWPQLIMDRARGTVFGSESAVLQWDRLFDFLGRGWDGSNYSTGGGRIAMFASQNFTGAAHGSHLYFYTTPNGATAPVEAMRIWQSQDISIGGVTPSARLHVDQSSPTGAKEAALFDQADENFAILKFVGTSAPGDADMSLVDAVDFSTLGALIGAFKVRLTDTTGGGIGTNVEGWVPVYAQLT